jgi:hypothetical protein
MARKLTATHDGQTFTRKTDRTYTHVVLVRMSLRKLQDRAHRYSAISKNGAAHYLSAIDGTWKYSHQPDPSYVTLAKEIQEFGLEEVNRRRAAAAVLRTAAEFDPGWKAHGWCGRPDLAQKLKASVLGNEWSCVEEAVIVPVTQP